MSDYMLRATAADGSIRAFAITSTSSFIRPPKIKMQDYLMMPATLKSLPTTSVG